MSISDEANEIREKLRQEERSLVKIALFGQPGAGKSSLINKLVGKKVADVGVETDKTTKEASYLANGLQFSDLPGYGTKNFPAEGYADRFGIPSFDLFLCVMSGKLHKADQDLFKVLTDLGKVCILVVNKADDLWEDGVDLETLKERKEADIRKLFGTNQKLIFTSCKDHTGLDSLEKCIQANLDGAKRERWLRGAKAYSAEFLLDKRNACERYVALAAGLAAANALNPIPGVDVAVDISIIVKLFKEIRSDFGLDDDFLAALKGSAIPAIGNLANAVLKYAFSEGVIILLKNVAGKMAVKEVAKYIPWVGQAIAASIGFGITSAAGSFYLEECYQLARATLASNLER
jgi:small GTP-binding protein